MNRLVAIAALFAGTGGLVAATAFASSWEDASAPPRDFPMPAIPSYWNPRDASGWERMCAEQGLTACENERTRGCATSKDTGGRCDAWGIAHSSETGRELPGGYWLYYVESRSKATGGGGAVSELRATKHLNAPGLSASGVAAAFVTKYGVPQASNSSFGESLFYRFTDSGRCLRVHVHIHKSPYVGHESDVWVDITANDDYCGEQAAAQEAVQRGL